MSKLLLTYVPNNCLALKSNLNASKCNKLNFLVAPSHSCITKKNIKALKCSGTFNQTFVCIFNSHQIQNNVACGEIVLCSCAALWPNCIFITICLRYVYATGYPGCATYSCVLEDLRECESMLTDVSTTRIHGSVSTRLRVRMYA